MYWAALVKQGRSCKYDNNSSVNDQ